VLSGDEEVKRASGFLVGEGKSTEEGWVITSGGYKRAMLGGARLW